MSSFLQTMPSRIVVQPNGFYAIFSTVVDHFTHYKLTREAAVKEASEAKVFRGEWDLKRFNQAIGEIKFHHGIVAAEAAKKLLTDPPA